MTDAKRKTLNERIALRRGWKLATGRHGHWENDQIHKSSGGEDGFSYGGPPDFTREIEHTWPLLIMLIRADQMPEGDDIVLGSDWLTINEIMYEGDTLIEAIALAYDAWKEEKK